MDVPKCCGEDMVEYVETRGFTEFCCDKCGDIVYVKKQAEKPQMLDD